MVSLEGTDCPGPQRHQFHLDTGGLLIDDVSLCAFDDRCVEPATQPALAPNDQHGDPPRRRSVFGPGAPRGQPDAPGVREVRHQRRQYRGQSLPVPLDAGALPERCFPTPQRDRAQSTQDGRHRANVIETGLGSFQCFHSLSPAHLSVDFESIQVPDEHDRPALFDPYRSGLERKGTGR